MNDKQYEALCQLAKRYELHGGKMEFVLIDNRVGNALWKAGYVLRSLAKYSNKHHYKITQAGLDKIEYSGVYATAQREPVAATFKPEAGTYVATMGKLPEGLKPGSTTTWNAADLNTEPAQREPEAERIEVGDYVRLKSGVKCQGWEIEARDIGAIGIVRDFQHNTDDPIIEFSVSDVDDGITVFEASRLELADIAALDSVKPEYHIEERTYSEAETEYWTSYWHKRRPQVILQTGETVEASVYDIIEGLRRDRQRVLERIVTLTEALESVREWAVNGLGEWSPVGFAHLPERLQSYWHIRDEIDSVLQDEPANEAE